MHKGLLAMLMVPLLLLSLSAIAQNREVTGKVTDARNGSPLVGVAVVVKGTSNGTTTNANGIFHLNVRAAATTLVVSYIGYVTRELPIEEGDMLVALDLSNASLNEVVVIGYG